MTAVDQQILQSVLGCQSPAVTSAGQGQGGSQTGSAKSRFGLQAAGTAGRWELTLPFEAMVDHPSATLARSEHCTFEMELE